MNNNILLFVLFFLILFQVVVSICFVKRSKQFVFLNVFFIINFLSIFYISLPAFIQLSTGISLVNASVKTITMTASYGAYFICVILIFSILNLKFFPINPSFSLQLNLGRRGILTFSFLSLISLFTLSFLIILINLPEAVSLWGNRPLQSQFNEMLQGVYKLNVLFYGQVIFILFFCLKRNDLRYFLLLLPYVILDLILLGKLYIFFVLVSTVVTSSLLGRRLNLLKLGLLLLLISSLAVLRTVLRTGQFEVSYLLQILGEFINTWEVSNLIYISVEKQDVLSSLLYSVTRVLPSIYYDTFVGSYYSYTNISTNLNNLDYGLAGNLVAESLAFGFPYMYFSPVFICVLFSFVGILPRLRKLSAVVLYVLVCIYILPMFRYSFYEFIFYPLFLLALFAIPYILLDLKNVRYKKATG
ncbi:hypothetical protein [Vibrio fluvialis]|uniref:hypothetical protein n=1 Tax=Vibrio fluvialis TaxID=676 RepID=UPI003D7CE0D8